MTKLIRLIVDLLFLSRGSTVSAHFRKLSFFPWKLWNIRFGKGLNFPGIFILGDLSPKIIGERFSATGTLTFSGPLIVGSDCSFNNNVSVLAGPSSSIKIGDFALVGPNVVFRSDDHAFTSRDKPMALQGHSTKGDITLEDDVWIGANAVICGGVTLGKGCIIAAGSVVTKSVAAYSVAAGVPAKVLKQRPWVLGKLKDLSQ